MRRTKEGAEQTKQSILQAAFDVFSNEGYESASLEKICKQAKVTRGAAYWHFKNKRDLYHQTIAKVIENMDLTRSEILADESRSLRDAVVEMFWRPRELQKSFVFIAQALDFYKRNPAFTEIGEEIERGEMRLYWFFLTELSKCETLPCPVEHLATILYTFFLGLYAHPAQSSIITNVNKETIGSFVDLLLVANNIAVSL